ncbi:hypothetical protein C8F01DRAFT_1046111 [Mycena amicta]|nr:hypothetical protein C8F01DRAFT_1046111 [Mycena amicta]
MTSSSLRHDSLPTELWLEVFTLLDSAHSYVVSHAPFQAVPGVGAESKACRDYFTVVLVCRNWRAWAIGLLYRSLKLSKFVQAPLAYYGHLVRRAVVPYTTTATEIHNGPMLSTEILSLCPNLEVLVRPPFTPSPLSNPRFEFDATCPSLSKLKRLDWWNYIEASRSGGINSLTSVLERAPNIEYLFIGGAFSHFTAVPFHSLGDETTVCLPRLRTLRINLSNALLLRHVMYRWELPGLENVVLDAPLGRAGTDLVWEFLGPRLAVVELGKHVRFLLDQFLGPCLRRCPQLRQLNYYLFITAPPLLEENDSFPSVECIGIHLGHTPFLGTEADEWEHLDRHVDAFCSDAFPNLRRLRISEMRQSIYSNGRFTEVQRRLYEKGCVVELH